MADQRELWPLRPQTHDGPKLKHKGTALTAHAQAWDSKNQYKSYANKFSSIWKKDYTLAYFLRQRAKFLFGKYTNQTIHY
jgi:hypothetical protein